MHKTLSAVILTYNAETQIENCLKSIQGWAQEIIIVDGKSSDKTIDICKKYTNKIYERPFRGSFSEDRNFGADQAMGDWIIQLDADEIVPFSFQKKFETIRNIPSYSAYKTRRKNFFLGHPLDQGPWYHYIHILYLKNKARFYGLVHERLEVEGEIGTLEAEIEHYPFSSIHQFIQRQNRYTTLSSEEMFKTQGILPWKKMRRHLYYKPIKMFWKLFIVKKGYRDGFHGFIFSVLYAFEHFLKWIKYWELTKQHES